MRVIYIRKSTLWYIILIAVALFFIAVNAIFTREYISKASAQFKEDIPIYSVETRKKKCSITFDCAWGADDIPAILESMDKYNAKGTFFIVGIWAEKYPDAVKLIKEKGHEIANHGYSHHHMASLSDGKMAEEITRCTDTLKKIAGVDVKLFRAPYGEYNAQLVKCAAGLGYETIQWDCDSLDWKNGISREDIYSRVVKKASNGSIILFHNDTLHTEAVLPGILETLTEGGFQFVTVSDLLIKGPYRIRFDGRQVPLNPE